MCSSDLTTHTHTHTHTAECRERGRVSLYSEHGCVSEGLLVRVIRKCVVCVCGVCVVCVCVCCVCLSAAPVFVARLFDRGLIRSKRLSKAG